MCHVINWSDRILKYHFHLSPDIHLPDGIEVLYPYAEPETRRCMRAFYDNYYGDNHKRTLLLGINPGRFGAGVTGVPFTDPIRLSKECGIPNAFNGRAELSSTFVYAFIHAMGGPRSFYSRFLISSVCPLGFLKDGKNYNYYDEVALQEAVLPLISENLGYLIESGARTDVVFSMGRGKNYKFLVALNEGLHMFDRVIPLPHPRWVMQYRLKSRQDHIDTYVNALQSSQSHVD